MDEKASKWTNRNMTRSAGAGKWVGRDARAQRQLRASNLHAGPWLPSLNLFKASLRAPFSQMERFIGRAALVMIGLRVLAECCSLWDVASGVGEFTGADRAARDSTRVA